MASAVASGPVGVAPHDEHARALGRVRLGDRPTDAATAPGHDRDPRAESPHRRSSSTLGRGPSPSATALGHRADAIEGDEPDLRLDGFARLQGPGPPGGDDLVEPRRLRRPGLERDRVQPTPAAVDAPQPRHREDGRIERHREAGPRCRVRDGQPAVRQLVDERELPRRWIRCARHRQVDRAAGRRQVRPREPGPRRDAETGVALVERPRPAGDLDPARRAGSASPGWIPHMNGIGSYPTLVRRWLDRTNDSPARSSIRRSIRNGVMIPAQPSSTATASGPSADDPARPGLRPAPRRGTGAAPRRRSPDDPSGRPRRSRPSTSRPAFAPKTGGPDVEPRMVVQQVTIGGLGHELHDLGPVRRAAPSSGPGRSRARRPGTRGRSRHR